MLQSVAQKHAPLGRYLQIPHSLRTPSQKKHLPSLIESAVQDLLNIAQLAITPVENLPHAWGSVVYNTSEVILLKSPLKAANSSNMQ